MCLSHILGYSQYQSYFGISLFGWNYVFFRNHLSVLTDLKMQINIEYRNESIHLSNPAPLIRIEWLLNQSID